MFKVRLSSGEMDTWTNDAMGRASMRALKDGLCYMPDGDGVYSIRPIAKPKPKPEVVWLFADWDDNPKTFVTNDKKIIRLLVNANCAELADIEPKKHGSKIYHYYQPTKCSQKTADELVRLCG